jgi:hypothetical protein
MHLYERIFAIMLDELLQQTGLKNDAATAQLLYVVHYYAKKLQHIIDASTSTLRAGRPL